MTVLAIDSSSITATVGIIVDGTCVAESFLNRGLTHSETLLPMIESVLSVAKMKPSQINKVVVTNGPGSFTGLRIGVSAALGFALPLGIECVGVSSLLAAALNVPSELSSGFVICPVMDARCNQVYTASFEYVGCTLKRVEEDHADGIEEVCKKFQEKRVIYVGDGAKLCYNPKKDIFIPSLQFIKAESVCLCADFGEARPAESLVYLRVPQAERERMKGK